jgi:hypothetical protein
VDILSQEYVPEITEGVYPEDGGWTTDQSGNVLLLSVPLLSSIIHTTVTSFDYTWLYDKAINAYIFCFKINAEKEYAVIFQNEHAGQLLITEEAADEFSIALTAFPFEELTDESTYLYLPKIILNRHTTTGL